MVRPIAAAALFLAAVSGSGQAIAADGWTYEAMPFLWASGLDGRQGFDGYVSEVHVDFGDLVEFVDVGAAMRLRGDKAPLGWFAEINHARLGEDVATSAGELGIRTSHTFAEGGMSYDLAPGFAVYGGVRYQSVELGLSLAEMEMRLDRDQDWIDAFAGVRWTPVDTDRWVAWTRADVGAGGSDFTWLGEIGAGYRFGKRWSAYAAYRVLDTDHTSRDFVYDIRQSGLLLGFGIRF